VVKFSKVLVDQSWIFKGKYQQINTFWWTFRNGNKVVLNVPWHLRSGCPISWSVHQYFVPNNYWLFSMSAVNAHWRFTSQRSLLASI